MATAISVLSGKVDPHAVGVVLFVGIFSFFARGLVGAAGTFGRLGLMARASPALTTVLF
jgi:hypothetical protein